MALEEHKRYQNYSVSNLDLDRSNSENVKNVDATCASGDNNNAPECPSMSYTCDNEDRTRSHRHSLRTTLNGRVLRNRRYRPPFDDHRHTKRLFTPEIKKYLKDWLIRRREHPYPNREEKRNLAVQTGLTYIQICNWFANWRRKLKNAGSQDQRTWTHLIQSYNTQAEGNVEQFSISSDDSIWERREYMDADDMHDDDDEVMTSSYPGNPTTIDHCYSVLYETQTGDCATVDNVVAEEIVVSVLAEDQPQCFTVSSTTTEDEVHTSNRSCQISSQESGSSNKYKRHIMEKYMKDLRLDSSKMNVSETNYKKRCSDSNRNIIVTSQQRVGQVQTRQEKRKKRKKSGSGSVKTKEMCPPPKMLSKWLESAAKFRPTKSYVPWTVNKNVTWPKKSRRCNVSGESNAPVPSLASTSLHWTAQGHQRAELDAAEALTCLSGLHQYN